MHEFLLAFDNENSILNSVFLFLSSVFTRSNILEAEKITLSY